MYSRLSPPCAWSCNLARACTPGLRTQRAAARKHRHSRLLARWSRTTPTRQGALHDPSRWAPRRRPVDDGRLRRCRERGRFWHHPLPSKAPDRPIFIADSISLAVSREKDGKLRIVYAGWDDAKVVEPSGVVELRAS